MPPTVPKKPGVARPKTMVAAGNLKFLKLILVDFCIFSEMSALVTRSGKERPQNQFAKVLPYEI